MLAVYGQVFPLESLALEGGGFATPAPSGPGSLYAGLHVRPVSLGMARPFVGTWIGAFGTGSHSESPSGSRNARTTGIRVGIDLMNSDGYLLTLEGNFLHVLGGTLLHDVFEGNSLFDPSKGWIPWAGLSFGRVY